MSTPTALLAGIRRHERNQPMEYRMIDCKGLTIHEEAIEPLQNAGWNPDTTNQNHAYLAPETARTEKDVAVLEDQYRRLTGKVILERTDEEGDVDWIHITFFGPTSNVVRKTFTEPGEWNA